MMKINYSTENRKELAKLIYNSTIISDESTLLYDVNELDFNQGQNYFYYSEIKVEKSYEFKIISKNSYDPFFETDLTNKEVNIIIANLDFNNKETGKSNWYTTEMIIIKYQNEINDFLAPHLTQIEYATDNIIGRNGLYEFSSSEFLTKNQIVKYYEKDDIVYNISVDLTNKEITYNVETTYNILLENSKVETTKTFAIENTFKQLENENTLNIINLTKINKIKTTANITKIEEDIIEEDIIYINSEETPSLISIKPTSYCTIQLNGTTITKEEYPNLTLEIGTIVEFYYYQRYENYTPKNITIDYINIIR